MNFRDVRLIDVEIYEQLSFSVIQSGATITLLNMTRGIPQNTEVTDIT